MQKWRFCGGKPMVGKTKPIVVKIISKKKKIISNLF